jgi:hypothetical protein
MHEQLEEKRTETNMRKKERREEKKADGCSPLFDSGSQSRMQGVNNDELSHNEEFSDL